MGTGYVEVVANGQFVALSTVFTKGELQKELIHLGMAVAVGLGSLCRAPWWDVTFTK